MMETKCIGIVKCETIINGEVVGCIEFNNTTLKIGRRLLAAAMGGNLLSDEFDARFDKMVFGKNGKDNMGNPIKIIETANGFIGGSANVLDEVPVFCQMVSGDAPAIHVTGVLPEIANSNGEEVNQVGLKMKNGQYYAIATWGGFAKSSGVSNRFTWRVVWL
jgi:hypothetical protein